MTTDMYRFKKEKETVKMEDTEEGNMKYKTHDTPYNNNNKERKSRSHLVVVATCS